MTNRKTQVASQFKKSVGAGFQSLVGVKGRTYFVLEFKTKTAKYPAGKSITFTSDYVAFGRDDKAAVKFSPNELFISREHAAIQREGKQYILKHLSQTNPTLLNNQPVAEQYILKNGDEIQLSLEGPKIGFMAPANNVAKSLPLSVRLDSFRREALLPYKTAFIISLVFFLTAITGLGYFLYETQQDNKKQTKAIVEATENIADKDEKLKEIQNQINEQTEKDKKEIARLTRRNAREQAALLKIIESNRTELANIQQERKREIIEKQALKEEQPQATQENELFTKEILAEAIALLQPYHKDIYKIYVDRVEYKSEGLEADKLKQYNEQFFKDYKWTGTGVLLSDGRFLTARHVIQPWFYINGLSGSEVIHNVLLHNFPDAEITAYFVAIAPDGKKISFNSKQFKTDDAQIFLEKNLEFGGETGLLGRRAYLGYSDWAIAKVSDVGIVDERTAASNISLASRPVFLVGFPTQNEEAEPSNLRPVLFTNELASEGIENHIIGLNNEVNAGFSGAAAFILEGGEVQFVGIVSAKFEANSNFIIPIDNLK